MTTKIFRKAIVLLIMLQVISGFESVQDKQNGIGHNPITLQEDDDNECLMQIRNILTPEYFKELTKVYFNTGKGINQLGDPYACASEKDYQHITLQIKEMKSGFTVFGLGICSPIHCNTQYHFSQLTNYLNKQFVKQDAQTTLKAIMVNPQAFDTSISAGAVIMILVIAFIGLLMIGGIIISYTNIGNKQGGLPEDTKITEKKSKWALAFVAFNPLANLNKLLTVSQEGDKTLDVLNGLRVFSMAWIIVGHSFSFSIMTAVTNVLSIGEVFETFQFGIVGGGTFAVDSFFWLSGFLTFYIITSKMYAKREIKSVGGVVMLYVHRFLRLIFPLVFIQFFMMFLMRYLGSGPFYWDAWNFTNKNCSTFWWSNLLFINNFIPWSMMDSCMGWTWYLANDFQLFAVSPFLIMAYCYNRKVGYIILYVLIGVSMALNGVFTAMFNISPTTNAEEGDAFALVYSKPWTRMGPYFVGAIVGLSYFELTKKEDYIDLGYTTFNKIYSYLRDSRMASLILAFAGIAITAIFCFPLGAYLTECGNMFDTSLPSNCWGYFPSVLFNTLSRVSFVVGVTFIFMPMFVQRLRVFRGLLANELFAVLARLCYICYLLHPVIIFWYLLDIKQSVYVSRLDLWFFSISTFIITCLFAVLFTLFSEAPFMNLEKYLLMPARKDKEVTKESFNYIGESQLIQNETANPDDEEEPSLNLEKKFD